MDFITLMALDDEPFVAALDGIFENAPWVARRALAGRPYPDLEALHAAMMAEIYALDDDATVAFLCQHPELAPATAATGMTAESRDEQTRAGLDALDDTEAARFRDGNRAYRERFGFPFIVCVAEHARSAILAQLEERVGNTRCRELDRALHEVAGITLLRLRHRLGITQAPSSHGGLTTHVLDTQSGLPAAGMRIELFAVTAHGRRRLRDAITNEDGRTHTPLLRPGALSPGRYALVFHVADYFRARGVALPDPPFLDAVSIDFGIAERERHHHVPLLAAPFGYTTYRGS